MITQNMETTALGFDLCSVCAFWFFKSARRKWPTPESLSSGDWGHLVSHFHKPLQDSDLKKLQLGYSSKKQKPLQNSKWKMENDYDFFSICSCSIT